VGMKYSIITFGCRVNQADSLGFEEELRARGAIAESPDRADLIIVNTCSVTSSADQGARQTVRRLARINPGAQVVVTGCYATRRPDQFHGLPNVLRVVSNVEKASLVSALATELVLTTSERFGDGDGGCGAAIEPGMSGRTAFTLRVQTGCAQPCAYCIIPTTRGEPRSVAVGAVTAEVDRIVQAGFKEIVLTGVHLGSYGRDLHPPASLIELLRALERGWTVLFRISSLEPMDCSPGVIDLVAERDGLAPHFHLPMQHASDRMLTAMRRPYTFAYYADLVDSIRARIPAASIGSDVIVGFPGETDQDFEQMCGYLERSPLTYLHVFPYSDRPGTAASALSAKVHGALIRERAARVRAIGHGLASRFRESQRGTIHRALTLEDGSLAVTGNYLKVGIPPGQPRNQWVRLKITKVDGTGMAGEIY
jgi:threonylcarbamoyladenosine tRNA methylthiotransferase MtaB